MRCQDVTEIPSKSLKGPILCLLTDLYLFTMSNLYDYRFAACKKKIILFLLPAKRDAFLDLLHLSEDKHENETLLRTWKKYQ